MKVATSVLQKEIERRRLEKERAKNRPFKIESYLFDKQLKFVQDKASFKVAVTSRRAGKTTSCGADLIDVATSNFNVICLYLTINRSMAKRNVWKEIKDINLNNKLGGHVNNTELSMTFPNGSIIYCAGAETEDQIEKFRGMPIKIAYIDECQSFRPHIEKLVDDVIAPALMDHNGTLMLIGTPGPLPKGYFYECAHNPTWSHHKWTFFDNPFIAKKSGKTHEELLQRELKRRNVKRDDPSIQREWFGQWVMDADSLLIHYDEKTNHFDTLPIAVWNYIIGVDIGHDDADAIAVLAWSDSTPTVCLVEEFIKAKQDITDLINKVDYFRKKYNASKIMIDQGGLGKKIAEEIRRRHHVPVVAADKARKMENVAFLNDALRTGRFMAKRDSRFAHDSYLVEIDREKSTPDRLIVKDSYHSDIIDAVLYSFKESPAFTYSPPVEKPKYGTPQWVDEEVKRLEEAAEEYFEALESTDKFNDWI